MKIFPTTFCLALCLTATQGLAQQGQPGAHFIENWDIDGDGTVTAEEAAERRGDLFVTFDSDEDGFLDGEEYGQFDAARQADMESQPGFGRGGMKRVADGLVREHNDSDGDGKVSREEFIGNAAAWVAVIDSNGDGVVTSADFGPAR